MDKKRIVGVSVLLFLLAGYFLYEQSKKTTYEEVMANLIDENEKIEQVTIYSQIPLASKTASASINNQELISNILNQQIKLKKIDTRKLPPILTTLVIKTDRNSYEIGFDVNSIMIGSARYLMTDPQINPIDTMLWEEGLDWEIGEYRPFLWQ